MTDDDRYIVVRDLDADREPYWLLVDTTLTDAEVIDHFFDRDQAHRLAAELNEQGRV